MKNNNLAAEMVERYIGSYILAGGKEKWDNLSNQQKNETIMFIIHRQLAIIAKTAEKYLQEKFPVEIKEKENDKRFY